jgi:hypothetical protein
MSGSVNGLYDYSPLVSTDASEFYFTLERPLIETGYEFKNDSDEYEKNIFGSKI